MRWENAMDQKEPVLTLLSWLVLAGGLMVLKAWMTTRAVRPNGQQDTADWRGVATLSEADVRPAAAPGMTATAVTYAGTIYDATASVAISVAGAEAVAYICDGERAELWLRGTAIGGQLTLIGPAGTLIGTVAGGIAAGTVTVAGQRWSFGVKARR